MEQIVKYFKAEKNESVLFILVGIAAISIAVYFFMNLKQAYYNGIAYPLIAVVLLQIVVGCSIYFRSPKDILRMEQMVKTDQSKIRTEEIPRMEVVMKNFEIYRWVEIALLLAGLIVYFKFQEMSLWKGVGLGLSIQAGLTLLLDFFAESRGKIYLEYLKTLV